MADVVNFRKVSNVNLSVEGILRRAEAASLVGCVIVGMDKDGEEFFASSYADGGAALWRLQRATKALLEVPERFRGEEYSGPPE